MKISDIRYDSGSSFQMITTISKVPKKFLISAENSTEAKEWVNALKQTIEFDMDSVKVKKKKKKEFFYFVKKKKNCFFYFYIFFLLKKKKK